MENTRKRKREEMSALDPEMGESVMTQSKRTRLRRDLDVQIAFLSQNTQVKIAGSPKPKSAQEQPYPVIIRRKFRTLDE